MEMDFTIIYTILIIIFVVGIVYLTKYLKKNNLVDTEDLQFAMNALNLSLAIVDELNLQSEQKIKQVASIVTSALEYSIDLMKLTDIDDITKTAQNRAYVLCQKNQIEVTESRKVIIDQLIVFTLYNKYLQK